MYPELTTGNSIYEHSKSSSPTNVIFSLLFYYINSKNDFGKHDIHF